jgi:proteasome accessory factor BC
MAKDTEKLIRQLSLISFLMAERRPVSALEIKQDVEGYSQMNDEAFARRFYADRAELDSLGIHLKVDKPAEGYYEAENYSLPPENFYLSAIEFTDKELGALRMSLSLLDGEFAYAEPLRLALQQLSWGKPSPLDAPEQRSVALAVTATAGGRELSQRLTKVETAIFRRKTIVFHYYTIGRDAEEKRKVDPYHLLFRGGQFYLIGYSHERDDVRVFRVSRIRGKVGYASKAEHDFNRPEEFDPRTYATRTDWQLGDPVGRARIWLSDRIDWLALRHFGHAGEVTHADGGVIFETDYADSRQMVAWVLGLGEQARIEGPDELAAEARERLELVIERHAQPLELAPPVKRRPSEPDEAEEDGHESPIRPERFARLVTLAGILIEAAREARKLEVTELCERLQVSEQELRQDIDVLNVVNFGGGSYVLYAEVQGDQIEVDPEPYGDNFARPARLLPLEAKALVAAIDLIGEHLPGGSLASARQKIVDALGQDPAEEGLQITNAKGDDSEIARVVTRAVTRKRLLRIDYYKENEDEFIERTIEPYKLANGQEGWYVHSYDLEKDTPRSYRLDRIREATVLDDSFEPRPGIEPDVHGWLATGEVPSSKSARIWVSPERARWEREDHRVIQELSDGAVIVERTYASHEWLARELLKAAGDAVVVEPEDARAAVLEAAEQLATARGEPEGLTPQRVKR